MWLEKLADEVPSDKSLEQFVSYVLERAKEDLRDFPHKTILHALEKQPDGVKIQPSLLNQGQVKRDLKLSNDVVYRMENLECQLMSTVHRTALLKTFQPLVKE